MFEKAKCLEDPKNRITPPGSSVFRRVRVLRLRPQNPKNRITLQAHCCMIGLNRSPACYHGVGELKAALQCCLFDFHQGFMF